MGFVPHLHSMTVCPQCDVDTYTSADMSHFVPAASKYYTALDVSALVPESELCGVAPWNHYILCEHAIFWKHESTYYVLLIKNPA